MICTKPFSLTVSAGCPDWDQLLWDIPTLNTAVNGTATFTPSSATSAVFTTSTSAPDGGAADVGQAVNEATLSYNGGPCNCNLHLVLAKGLSTASVLGNIDVTINSVLVLSVAAGGAPDGTMPSGTYDLPFVAPNSGGVPFNIVINITSLCISGGFPDDSPSISMVGTFSNV